MNFFNPNFHIENYRNLFQFLKNPKFKKEIISKKQVLFIMISLLILKYVFTIFFRLSYTFINHKPIHTVQDHLHHPIPIWDIIPFFTLYFLKPFLEEVAFRLSLKFSPVYMAFSTFALIFYMLSIFYDNNFNIRAHLLLKTSLSLIAGVTMYFISNQKKILFENFWNKNFRYIFYLLLVIFLYANFLYYKIDIRFLVFLPLLLSQKILTGVIHSFVRVKYGFRYSLLLSLFYPIFYSFRMVILLLWYAFYVVN